MKIIAHDSDTEIELKSKIGSEYPYLFLKEYHGFEKKMGNETYFAVSDDKDIFMPFRVIKKYFFNQIQILYPPLRNADRLSEEKEKIFLEEFINICKEKNLTQRISQSFLIACFKAYPDSTKHCKFGSYFLPLEGRSQEEITSGFQDRYQRAIRSVEKQGAEIRYGKDQLIPFYEIFKDTMIREKKYVDPYSFFEKYMEELKEDHLLCAVAYFNGKPQGALWVPYTNYGGFLLYGGSVARPDNNGIIKYLHAQIAFELQKRGVKNCYFGGARLSNTEGSKQYDIQKFKERFGCHLEKGYLWKKDINSKITEIYDLSLNTKLLLKGIQRQDDVIDYEAKKENR